MAIRITKNVLDGIDRSASLDELLNLLAINGILTTLGLPALSLYLAKLKTLGGTRYSKFFIRNSSIRSYLAVPLS